MASPSVPPIPLAIVEYLERLYPEKSPDLSDSERMIWYKAGQASVAAKIRHEFKNQNKRANE